MAVVPLFKNRHGNVAVVRAGMTIKFNSGRYFTTDERQLKLLTYLAKTKQQGVYIDPKEPEIDTEAATPMEVLKKKIINEYLAEQNKLGPASSYGSGQALGQSVGTTASSTIMNNGMAEIVDAAKTGTEGPETPAKPENAGALSVLEKLKASGKP